ncbi:MAG: recombinase [Candidatus Lokiarchaeota archaeon]|nr:recombinase [Candidatus Lokiarchaeota archaeon]MBD3350051.1 recombinase [Candidatus Lokiarchaeota archaeon]
MKKTRSKKPSLKVLKKKAWKVFSEYIRRRDKGICITCGKKDNWQLMHAGHFKHGKLDFDEVNINCQCVSCNRFKHGRLDVYAEKLIEKHGHLVLSDLVKRSNEIKKHSRDELEIIIEKYGRKINEMD